MPLVFFYIPWKYGKTWEHPRLFAVEQPDIFQCFQGVKKETSDMKWVSMKRAKMLNLAALGIWVTISQMQLVKGSCPNFATKTKRI